MGSILYSDATAVTSPNRAHRCVSQECIAESGKSANLPSVLGTVLIEVSA